ncbi:MAG: HEPN domain-containing protein [Nitrospirae bacterium]|nr:HEPN domain-containing protein [Nitrospirota bacterium]
MTDAQKALIVYRLARANECLDEARLLMEKGHANTFVNRLYYACFYAVSALLLLREASSAKHSGTRSLFHQMFVKTGSIDIEKGQLYDRLFDNRQKADYADFIKFNLEDVHGWLEEAEQFVYLIEAFVDKELNSKTL